MTLIELISTICASIIGVVSMISAIVHVIYGKKTYSTLCAYCKGTNDNHDSACIFVSTPWQDFLKQLSSGSLSHEIIQSGYTYYLNHLPESEKGNFMYTFFCSYSRYLLEKEKNK